MDGVEIVVHRDLCDDVVRAIGVGASIEIGWPGEGVEWAWRQEEGVIGELDRCFSAENYALDISGRTFDRNLEFATQRARDAKIGWFQ